MRLGSHRRPRTHTVCPWQAVSGPLGLAERGEASHPRNACRSGPEPHTWHFTVQRHLAVTHTKIGYLALNGFFSALKSLCFSEH